MTNSIANSSTMNLLPVQAYFNADGSFNTFFGQGLPFTITLISGATINNSSIGATTPSTGAFTSLSSTLDASISGLTVGKGGGSVASNSAVGYGALYSNTSGVNNTGVGYASLYTNSIGSQNTALGYQSLALNTTASNNTAVGYQAGYSNMTGTDNYFAGYKAGYASVGTGNTFVGSNAGVAVNTYGGNSFFGKNSGNAVTTGYNNTIIGSYTGNNGGLDIRTASNYIVLSDGDGNPLAYAQNGGGWYQKNNSAAWSITSDVRIKKNVESLESGLDIVNALRPVEFDYIETDKHDIGFIAQEYQTVLPAQVAEDGNGMLSLNQNLVPYLVKAIQELTAEIQSLKSQLGVK